LNPNTADKKSKIKRKKTHHTHSPSKHTHTRKKKHHIMSRIALIAALIVLCLLVTTGGLYLKRADIIQWIIGLPNIQKRVDKEIRTVFMSELVPRLRKEIDLSFLQKSGAFILRKRGEKQREQDAINAVDRFIRNQTKEKKLGVMVSSKLNQFDSQAFKRHKKILTKYFISIVWRYDKLKFDVVAAFNISFKDGLSMSDKVVNEKGRFFKTIAAVAEKAARD